jgi:hypothetical protein
LPKVWRDCAVTAIPNHGRRFALAATGTLGGVVVILRRAMEYAFVTGREMLHSLTKKQNTKPRTPLMPVSRRDASPRRSTRLEAAGFGPRLLDGSGVAPVAAVGWWLETLREDGAGSRATVMRDE